MADSYSWLNLPMRATVCAGAINVIKAIVNLAGCGMRDAELRIPHPASRKVRDAGCGLRNRTKLPFSASIPSI